MKKIALVKSKDEHELTKSSQTITSFVSNKTADSKRLNPEKQKNGLSHKATKEKVLYKVYEPEIS